MILSAGGRGVWPCGWSHSGGTVVLRKLQICLGLAEEAGSQPVCCFTWGKGNLVFAAGALGAEAQVAWCSFLPLNALPTELACSWVAPGPMCDLGLSPKSPSPPTLGDTGFAFGMGTSRVTHPIGFPKPWGQQLSPGSSAVPPSPVSLPRKTGIFIFFCC